jgi:ribosomal-protein-alanine N-acetyltransferase
VSEVAIPEIHTARLLLRGWRDDDLAPFAAMNADPPVVEYLAKALTREESDAFVAWIGDAWGTRGFGQWALERLDTGAFVGFTGLSAPSFEAAFTPAVEVGWRLAADAWGHGFATEAAEAALAFGFGELGLPEIVSVTTVGNERSIAVMRRLGMTRDPADDFLHPNLPDGHPLRPHVMYRLRRDDWERARGKPETAR